jgi:hypothetical protein
MIKHDERKVKRTGQPKEAPGAATQSPGAYQAAMRDSLETSSVTDGYLKTRKLSRCRHRKAPKPSKPDPAEWAAGDGWWGALEFRAFIIKVKPSLALCQLFDN